MQKIIESKLSFFQLTNHPPPNRLSPSKLFNCCCKSKCPNQETKRREPKSSRLSARNATPLRKEVPTSKDPTFTDFSDANLGKPMDFLTAVPTRRVVSCGERTHCLNTWRTQRSTLRCVSLTACLVQVESQQKQFSVSGVWIDDGFDTQLSLFDSSTWLSNNTTMCIKICNQLNSRNALRLTRH